MFLLNQSGSQYAAMPEVVEMNAVRILIKEILEAETFLTIPRLKHMYDSFGA